nr:UBN2 domain-containing protein [Tanacetum cinerariifolium]
MCKTAIKVWHTLVITHQGNFQVKNFKIDLLTQEYKKFSISNEETIDNGFTRFIAMVTSLKSLDLDYFSKNNVRKFLRALSLKWRAKVKVIKEAKDLATIPLDELVGNLKVYEMVLDNDGIASRTTKEKSCSKQRPALLEPDGYCFWKSRFEIYVKSKVIDLWQVIKNGNFYYKVKDSKTKLIKETPYEILEDDQKKKLRKNNKAKLTLYNSLPRKEYERVFMCKTAIKEKTRDDSNSQGGSDEGIDEEEVEAFNLLARNLRRENRFEEKGGESSKKKGACNNCEIEGHFASKCRKPKKQRFYG